MLAILPMSTRPNIHDFFLRALEGEIESPSA
jgi:hypothetical protein